MKYETFMNTLIREGSIQRIRVNRYVYGATPRTRAFGILADSGIEYTAQDIRDTLGTLIAPGNIEFRPLPILMHTVRIYRISGAVETYQVRDGHRFTGVTEPTPGTKWITRTAEDFNPAIGVFSDTSITEVRIPTLRRITRNSYHSNGGGHNRHGISEALALIERDEDQVRRSYGLEWEIYSLNEQQEDKLARLLDTLPAHITERDGSLASNGVEIVFMPLGKEKVIEVWNTLKNFCGENNIQMSGTGAHITFGVSNSVVNITDLQIRLNRVALAVKATATQRKIIEVFGRDFTSYASLPTATTTNHHSNAISASRGTTAFELRLCCWKGQIEKIVAFLESIEFVFSRTFTPIDFMNIFNIFGNDANGE